MRIVVCSDLHLDWSSRGGVDRYDELNRAMDQVEERAAEADALFFLGDLANPGGARTFRAVGSAIERAARLSDKGIEQVWMPGNHDVVEEAHGTSTLTPLAAAGLRGVHVVSEPGAVTVCGRLQVVALPHAWRGAKYSPSSVIDQVPRVRGSWRVVAGHLALPDLDPGSETEDMARGKMIVMDADVPARDLWLNGHYHEGGEHKTRHGRVWVPGSLARLTWGEASYAPGFVVAERRSGARRWTVERVHVTGARRLITVGPAHDFWAGSTLDEVSSGDLVRGRPPAGADRGRVEELVSACEEAGARPVLDPVVDVMPVEDGEEDRRGGSLRDQVLDVVDRSWSKDPALLRATCERMLDEEGVS